MPVSNQYHRVSERVLFRLKFILRECLVLYRTSFSQMEENFMKNRFTLSLQFLSVFFLLFFGFDAASSFFYDDYLKVSRDLLYSIAPKKTALIKSITVDGVGEITYWMRENKNEIFLYNIDSEKFKIAVHDNFYIKIEIPDLKLKFTILSFDRGVEVKQNNHVYKYNVDVLGMTLIRRMMPIGREINCL